MLLGCLRGINHSVTVGVCAVSHILEDVWKSMCFRVCLRGSVRVEHFRVAQMYLLIREALDRNRGDLSKTPVCRHIMVE